ncbi:hypothetical protein Syun_012229 [Stephania yunnanensis]|uniref:Uncharacterized protein n=1 Tax=Stephania yunnanensis TaxID=152371 RepID=A0AAP0I2C6_9MAGN
MEGEGDAAAVSCSRDREVGIDDGGIEPRPPPPRWPPNGKPRHPLRPRPAMIPN